MFASASRAAGPHVPGRDLPDVAAQATVVSVLEYGLHDGVPRRVLERREVVQELVSDDGSIEARAREDRVCAGRDCSGRSACGAKRARLVVELLLLAQLVNARLMHQACRGLHVVATLLGVRLRDRDGRSREREGLEFSVRVAPCRYLRRGILCARKLDDPFPRLDSSTPGVDARKIRAGKVRPAWSST